ncbi:MAG: PIN domain-containing protein [Clostridia bacterium]|nr:PIN domain-containing protein [Clostridia bacterium]MDH7574033.1 PIN domain-containing protein [Clostridia bacterium]
MILVDTGALYALIDRNDVNHAQAAQFYRRTAGREVLGIGLPVLTEAYLLLEARLGGYYADRLWSAVAEGVFEVLPLEREDLLVALDIQGKYQDAGFGFVDATCFALCERYRLRRVFTYDRKHFALYRPAFAEGLELLP